MDARLTLIGFMLVFIGLLLIVLGLLAGALRSGGRVEGGAVVIIGPFPIVVGSSPGAAKALMVLGIVLTVVVVIAYLLMRSGYPH